MSGYTIAGLFFGLLLFVAAIMLATDNYFLFLSAESLLMVAGGTLANAFISFQGRYVIRALGDVGRMWGHARTNEPLLYADSRKVVEWARLVQTRGALALEKQVKASREEDHFLATGIQLVTDGYKGGEVRELLTNAMNSEFQRATVQVKVLKSMAAASPAFGMVGTLVGLIIMLDSLGTNPDGIGQGLALALLTTLYGVLVARFIFQPAADKTLQREEIMRFRNFILMEGFVMIAEQRPARYIKERIDSYLDPGLVQQLEDTGAESVRGAQ